MTAADVCEYLAMASSDLRSQAQRLAFLRQETTGDARDRLLEAITKIGQASDLVNEAKKAGTAS